MQSSQCDFQFKVILVGDAGVGKTCVLYRFASDLFDSTLPSTIGVDLRIRTLIIDGKTVKFRIWDTAGQEKYGTITTAHYRGANGIFIVYDITHRETFDNLGPWMDRVSEYASQSAIRFIVGNKADLDSRQVSRKEAQSFADRHAVTFFETSAKDATNVEECFEAMAKILVRETYASRPGIETKEKTEQSRPSQSRSVDLNRSSSSSDGGRGRRKCCSLI